MARRIEHRATTRWTAAQVHAALVDPTYLQDRLTVLGGKGATLLEHSSDNGNSRFRLRHGIASADLPPAVRSFLKGDLVIERTETWQPATNGGYQGTVQAGIPGVPGHIKGQMLLVDGADGGSVLGMRGEVVVNIPLFGGKIEETIAAQVVKLLQKESEHTAGWLAEHSS
ncbi:hypothetical protein BC739_008961 [Kutzneria viridogrisea]|uniref:DUF2505 domain-containing protein n=1 Tax=Kutzneria viridogrisea TaxID=47990 RepID=A0ABR6BXS1_9PSEU|nr:hypothetical protein [Kutzneria viridogrisea]